jgi:DNA-binding response OmpR family regulator
MSSYSMSMSPEPHVLIVDDERDILDPLASYLSKNGFRVSKARDAIAAREIIAAHAIDIALIDIMMPGEDGLSLTGFLRATAKTPVILLTAKAEETDRIVGLELGADDYVSKPFSPRKLVARIKAVLRRTSDGSVRAPDADAFAFADWALRTGERALVTKNGKEVALSSGEYYLLLATTRNRQSAIGEQFLAFSKRFMGIVPDRPVGGRISSQ